MDDLCSRASFTPILLDLVAAGFLAFNAAETIGSPWGNPRPMGVVRLSFWATPTLFLLSSAEGIIRNVDCNRFYNDLANREAAQAPKAHDEPFDSQAFKSPKNREPTCLLGDQTACADLGMHYYLGRGVTRNLVRANALFKKACDGGVAHACYNLANSYEEGEGVAKDLEQAQLYYRRACEAGDQEACSVDLSEPEAP